jgi:transposase-like protein
MLRTYVQARQVARSLGIKTGTLAKWRRQGRGPKGWLRISRTSVVYPQDEVEKFLRELGAPSEPLEKTG